ncbi:terminase [Mesorhizobium sp.]|uniref:terminase n=1 Tax=Mesorhizobium sp. TaxID=1871066 RepID=UPI000FE2B8DE|nr:terminase [Mesorhizobium sp.]RWN55571.1 MAG: terminase [Mesorhizobium sp.]RWN77279.1 MAG: terminase [Mesorhizobium sp.]RWN80182.1 MAG: terminase [Mesorhizobium sp.]RWN86095.1 MAG: terminase [Mesorhizobium sp.]RWO15015.1 MAG: terminase [Mesorhizobium sp.]
MIHETIDDALADPLLLGAALGDLSSWSTWRTIFRAAWGQTLTEDELDLLAELAGPGRSPPTERVRELWVLAGRRGGKSRAAALVASYIATLDHSGKLAPGETGFIVVMSPTKDQSKTIFNYIKAFFAASPVLRQMVVNHNSDEIELDNRVTIAVTTNSFRTVRSRTLLAAIFDETAFWRDETSANPDLEIYRATIPALITTGGMLVGISSPYRKIGLIYQKHRDNFNKDGPVLVIKADTRKLNPTIDQARIDEEYAADPEAAASEWGGNFRSDISSLLDDDSIDRAIDPNRPVQLPPQREHAYFAFVDASAGRHDAFTMCIGYTVGSRFIAAAIVGRKPPFDPNHVAAEFAKLAKDYGCSSVTGDNYSGEWVVSAFEAAGMAYIRAPVPKSQLYVEAVPSFVRGAISFADLPILVRELRLLERRTHRSGKDSVDHPTSGSDDYANVLCGCLYIAKNDAEAPQMQIGRYGSIGGVIPGHQPDPEPKNGSMLFSGLDYAHTGHGTTIEGGSTRNAGRSAYLDLIKNQE